MSGATRDVLMSGMALLFLGFCVYMMQTCEVQMPASIEMCARSCAGSGVAKSTRLGCECK